MEWAIEHGGDCPDELVDLELCQAYGWTWDELQATPLYVRQLAWQHQQMKHAARAQQQPQPRTEAGGAPHA